MRLCSSSPCHQRPNDVTERMLWWYGVGECFKNDLAQWLDLALSLPFCATSKPYRVVEFLFIKLHFMLVTNLSGWKFSQPIRNNFVCAIGGGGKNPCIFCASLLCGQFLLLWYFFVAFVGQRTFYTTLHVPIWETVVVPVAIAKLPKA